MNKYTKETTLLIVDDQSTDIVGPYMLAQHLGFPVVLAFDGRQALGEVMRRPSSLVILDWNMPVMSGGEFLIHLEAEPAFAARPLNLILYSAEAMNPENFEAALNFKVLDIWKKPLGAIEMLRRIKSIREKLEV